MEHRNLLPEMQPARMPTAPMQPAPVPTAPVPTAPMQPAPVPTAPMQPAPVPAAPMQPAPMQAAEQQVMMPRKSENLPMQLVYPEVYYRLQPFIILICDQFENHKIIPTQELVDQVSNSIYTEVCEMYPDLVNYNLNQANDDDPPFIRDFDRRRRGDFNHDFFMRRFRRRGSLRDLISILLLSEIFRRF